MSYSVTPFRQDEHREVLARLWTENMSDPRVGSRLPARMRWFYEEGPDGPPTTLLCTDVKSGDVVGCGSFVQRPTWIGGRRLSGAVLCDFAVAKAHRIGGAALAIQRALMAAAGSAGHDLLYGYPNHRSVALFKRIGYRFVGETSAWMKPLHSAYKLRGVLPWTWAGDVAAGPVDLGLALMDRVRRLGVPASGRGELFPPSDGRAQDLWEQACTRYEVIGEKSGAYLEWRYGRFVTLEHRFFGLLAPGDGRLTGYAVFTVEDGKALVRDLFTDRTPGSEEALLLGLAEHLRAQRADAMLLSFIGSPSFGERLRKLGFLRRQGTRSVVVDPSRLDESTRARVSDAANWFMLDGELDI
jgi:hypothetical protein